MKDNKKPIIGIISHFIKNENYPFQSYIAFKEYYVKRIINAGGVPLGIIFLDDYYFKEELDLCDGFILMGGSIILSEQIKAVDYIIKSNKPCLGICLGMQLLVAYDFLKQNSIFDYNDTYEKYFLKKVKNHCLISPFCFEKINESKHLVKIESDSVLKEILHKNVIRVPSLHNYQVRKSILKKSNLFKVTGVSSDNVIEVIECIDKNKFIIGVQFHPELEDEFIPLFKKLVEKSLNQ